MNYKEPKGGIKMNIQKERVAIPKIDQALPRRLEIATFALGCFWSPDAMFGSIHGVVRTRVGYSGGKKTNPTYHDLGDHTETVQIEYDPSKVTYEQLLELFWKSHDPTKEPWSQQYKTIIFFHNERQEELARMGHRKKTEQLGVEVYTQILPSGKFYLAEEYHQKYRLRHEPDLMREFSAIYPDHADFVNSTAAARVNGYLSGYGAQELLATEIDTFGLSQEKSKLLMRLVGELQTEGKTKERPELG